MAKKNKSFINLLEEALDKVDNLDEMIKAENQANRKNKWSLPKSGAYKDLLLNLASNIKEADKEIKEFSADKNNKKQKSKDKSTEKKLENEYKKKEKLIESEGSAEAYYRQKLADKKKKQDKALSKARLSLKKKRLREAIIMAEILDKPVSKRK